MLALAFLVLGECCFLEPEVGIFKLFNPTKLFFLYYFYDDGGCSILHFRDAVSCLLVSDMIFQPFSVNFFNLGKKCKLRL